MNIGENEAAINDCEEVLTNDPLKAKQWVVRGTCLLALSKPHPALESFKRGYQLSPTAEIRAKISLVKTDKNGCAWCSKENDSLKCGKCFRALYCSDECQAADWTLGHKQLCMAMKEADYTKLS